MKKVTILTLAITMIAGFALRAADAPKNDKAAREARRAEMLKKYDKNSDGKLDEQERAAMREDLRKQRKDGPAKKDAPAK